MFFNFKWKQIIFLKNILLEFSSDILFFYVFTKKGVLVLKNVKNNIYILFVKMYNYYKHISKWI
ncbi:Conserved hypothetical protein [Clostridium acetobutylicum EA 2018]|uniref:Uncharacterized protein n=1 Tax=Clostridium acetobutylicum (strain ATCC 824 / DSM 792 / JCM 1419 / IAM 19013 / LMG 5710 / NBRC 13948 / NRRL B-527 / VKM B-1787 / 2291 / W) TaxID=272562 RepID=Q97I12_CLOAB|nr:Hypothetical protein CA_C1844 [Clostridium acetobutylicum ATCC 824]ADZ20894.1 Conserved hypothetical protein [Clostridium acetobutylicum EA 2018]AEI31994.1 hypothetical protein SMB_G1869 [Clostridium acetobutylicum DSM 1731]AWV82216.1 hypothetical protein DK921_06540 [Clostridium acetobutylicum]PSM07984.1 hypothetical protein C7T89_06540 [Clostridium sp. NJ4]